jgi:hypothetical protein
MWDDLSVQVRFVRFLCGMAAPAILLIEFALNKVIAHFCNSHWQMASLESIRVEFAKQSRDRFAGSLRVGVLADCADHPSAIDSFPKRPFVGPTELPNIWTALATTPDQTPLLHSCLRHRSCDAEEFLRRGCKTETPGDCPSELLCGGNAITGSNQASKHKFL